MKTMKLLALLLPLLSFVTNLFAEEKPAEQPKDTSVILRGEHNPDTGYRVYFSEDKKKYLNLMGYAKYDFSATPNEKMSIPYFRFHFDGKNDQWGFVTRIDYNTYSASTYSLSTSAETDPDNPPQLAYTTEAKGTPSIYFARAYITYAATDSLTFGLGRDSNLLYKYDVLTTYFANSDVSLAAKATYKSGNFKADAMVNYIQPTDDFGTPLNPTTDITDKYVYAVSASYSKDIGENSLGMHFSARTDSGFEGTKYLKLFPALTFNFSSGLYVFTQGVYSTYYDGLRNDANDRYQDYFEVGYEFTKKLTIDLYQIVSGKEKEEWMYNYGIDAFYRINDAVYLLGNVEAKNITEEENFTKRNRSTKTEYVHNLRISYNF